VAYEGFAERHVQVVAVGRTAVVGAQPREHLAVAVGVQDALQDDVVSGVQGVSGDGVDEADVRRARHVPSYRLRSSQH
jgi:hypothetical protein